MDAETVLTFLLYLTLAFAILLILISTAMVGRKLADLEYQVLAGINGVRGIQSRVNLRTHANRVLLGVTFVVVSALLIADAPIVWRTWTNRVLFAAVTLSYLVNSVLDWRAERQQVQIIEARQQAQLARDLAAGAIAAPVTAAPEPASVDVRHLQAPAVDQIVAASTPAIVDSVVQALPDAIPPVVKDAL